MERIGRFTVLGANSEPQLMAAVRIPWTELTRRRILLAGITSRSAVMACYEITQGALGAHRVAQGVDYAYPDGIMFRLAPFGQDGSSPTSVRERAMPADAGIGDMVQAYWSDRLPQPIW